MNMGGPNGMSAGINDDDPESDNVDVEDLDADDLDVDQGDLAEGRRWASIAQPGPLGLAGLVLSGLSILGVGALDRVLEARHPTDGQMFLRPLAIQESIAGLLIAAIGGLMSLAAFYVEDIDAPGWVRSVSRAGLLVGAITLALHVVLVIMAVAAPTL